MSAILVIDDNADYRADLTEILELESYKTLQAENGLIGSQIMREHSPSLVLCDVDMPIMNGIELLRSAKADPNSAKIPFVMLTGNGDTQTKQTAFELGADGFVTKPVDITDFLAMVTQFLQEKNFTNRIS